MKTRELVQIIGAIRNHDHERLREWVMVLKQSDDEGWAIGEMIERALAALEESSQEAGNE